LPTGFNFNLVAAVTKLKVRPEKRSARSNHHRPRHRGTGPPLIFFIEKSKSADQCEANIKYRCSPAAPSQAQFFPFLNNLTKYLFTMMSLNHSEQFYWLDPLGIGGSSRVRKVRHKYNSQVLYFSKKISLMKTGICL